MIFLNIPPMTERESNFREELSTLLNKYNASLHTEMILRDYGNGAECPVIEITFDQILNANGNLVSPKLVVEL